MYDDKTNTHTIFGTQEEFEKQYGETTSDGIPRFGNDYAFLHHPNELTTWHKFKSTDNPIEKIVYGISALFP